MGVSGLKREGGEITKSTKGRSVLIAKDPVRFGWLITFFIVDSPNISHEVSLRKWGVCDK